MEENEFESMDQDIIETDAEVMDDSSDDDDVVVVPGLLLVGVGAALGIVVDRVVVPAAVNAFNGVKNFITEQINKKDYVEVENDDTDKEAKN